MGLYNQKTSLAAGCIMQMCSSCVGQSSAWGTVWLVAAGEGFTGAAFLWLGISVPLNLNQRWSRCAADVLRTGKPLAMALPLPLCSAWLGTVTLALLGCSCAWGSSSQGCEAQGGQDTLCIAPAGPVPPPGEATGHTHKYSTPEETIGTGAVYLFSSCL